MDDDVKLNYGVFETQDVEWLTPNEILNLLEALKMVPRTKIRSMPLGDHIHMQSERNYDEAWRVITSKPPGKRVYSSTRFGQCVGYDLFTKQNAD